MEFVSFHHLEIKLAYSLKAEVAGHVQVDRVGLEFEFLVDRGLGVDIVMAGAVARFQKGVVLAFFGAWN